MGHREDLLAGAKRCLYEKGYAHTTARDIVAASGTNLASIGYHFGSKEELLTAALMAALEEMGTEFAELSRNRWPPTYDELAQLWQAAIDRLPEFRALLVSQVEAWAQAERSPRLRERLAELYEHDRTLGSETIRRLHPELPEQSARAVSMLTLAIADGLTMQWLVDPDRTPTGADLARGLRAIAELVADEPGAEPSDPPGSSGP